MAAIECIRPLIEYPVDVSAPSLPDLLVEWLSNLLVQKDLTGLVFSRFEVTIAGTDRSGFSATGSAFGEVLDRQRHRPGAEIKGITTLGLDVSHRNGQWVIQVVVDV
jgi:tRNA nucleotidyltransferase (CCA-adding enzyme)